MDLEDFHLIHLLYDRGHECEFDPNICNLSDDWKKLPTPELLEKTVYVYDFPVPVEYVEKKIWDIIEKVPNQNVQEYEQSMYIRLELDYTPNGKPLWNKEKQAFKNK